MKRDQIISFKISEELKKKIKDLADGEGRSLSNFVHQLLLKESKKSKKR